VYKNDGGTNLKTQVEHAAPTPLCMSHIVLVEWITWRQNSKITTKIWN